MCVSVCADLPAAVATACVSALFGASQLSPVVSWARAVTLHTRAEDRNNVLAETLRRGMHTRCRVLV